VGELVSAGVVDLVERLGGQGPRADAGRAAFLIVRADDHPARLAAYRALRRRAFVEQQGLFSRDDGDEHDGAERTGVLVAVGADGTVLGGVRLHPEGDDPGLGWWRGSRLVVGTSAGAARGRIGSALVASACVAAIDAGALRFDAHVQAGHARFFARLGWERVRPIADRGGVAHELMRWPIDRVEELVTTTKAALGPLLSGLVASGEGWLGDDGAPVPGAGGLIAATDAILPAMVDRDPQWAGWCGMLVTAHDLSAMGARPVGALDTIGAADVAHAERIVRGLRAGSEALGLPVLGGHTTLGVPGSLGVTGLGRTDRPVPAGGGRVGDRLTLTADLEGGWRPGYRARQWDSTSWRSRDELAAMLGAVARAQPHAAKDVSMAGAVGTAGMLAEASGCGAEIDVARVARPGGVGAADWLTCFPGFAMLTADAPGAPPLDAGPARGAPVGELVAQPGVRLRWPDGDVTVAVHSNVTGLGKAA
jgi:putative N-acetyltransferase (TIGR04045 family)